MSKVGIKDIAARTGVSIATVSHAFRNPGRVADATREKVLAAASEVGYSPNKLAASLRTARSGNIVAIIPDISDSHNSKIIKAIEVVARSRGYSVLLGDTQGSEKREREFAAMTRTHQADGIILMSHRIPFDIDKDNPGLEDLPPLVNGCESTAHEGILSVAIDDLRAAKDAMKHLIDYGHRNIAVITGDMESPSSQHRLEGFHSAMAETGLKVNERWVMYGGYSSQDGENATQELLLQKDRPTAIFCFSDEIAFGCMYALRQNGFDIPGDVSVIGFDNVPFARYCAPSLTTISQPTEEIGTRCATLLLDLIDGEMPEEIRTILPHELIVRESTKRLNP